MTGIVKKSSSGKSSSAMLTALTALVVLAGASAITLATIRQALAQERAWLMMLALALIVAPLGALYIPGLKAKVVLGEMVTFSCALLFGPNAAVIAALADGTIISLKVTRNPRKFIYNVASMAASMAAAAFATRVVFPDFGTSNARPVASVILETALFTLLYFVISTSLIAAYIAASKGEPVLKLWKENFLWTSISFIASGATALAAYYLVGRFGYTIFLVFMGVMMLVFLFYRTYFRKVEDANQRAGQMEELNYRTIEALIAALGAIGYATKMNIRRVERLAVELGRRAGCSEDEIRALRIAAMLHDVGNMAVPQQILEKPGALTVEEFGKVKVHPRIGAMMVESIGFPFPVAAVIRHHHERFDGTGYPDGLKGQEIPLSARVLGLVDCYNALTVDRPYRQRLSRSEALELMRGLSGKAFDPGLFEEFLSVVSEVDEEACRAQSETVSINEIQAEILSHRRAWQAA